MHYINGTTTEWANGKCSTIDLGCFVTLIIFGCCFNYLSGWLKKAKQNLHPLLKFETILMQTTLITQDTYTNSNIHVFNKA